MEIDKILSSVMGASANVSAIEASLYEVVKLPLPSPAEGFNAPTNAFGVYKSTGGNSLSVMGKDFVPTQPKEYLSSILYSIHECGADLNPETLRFNSFDGGRKIEFSIELPALEFVNKAGRFDQTLNRMTFSTSYDGSKSNHISLYTYRQICSNGMMGWGLQTVLKGKNTAGGKVKILNYCDELVQVIESATEHNERMQHLNSKDVKEADVQAFLLKLQGYNRRTLAGSDKAETKKLNILTKIEESIELEFSRTGATAFGLLNGVTNYTNHVVTKPKGVSDEEYIRFSHGAKMNDLAQKLVLEMN